MIPNFDISLRLIFLHLGLVVLGGIGGEIARHLNLPLPYILGSLLAVAIFAQGAEFLSKSPETALIPPEFKFNERFRAVFIAVIGVAIGTKITMEVILALPKAAYSFAALTVFVPLTFYSNYLIFRRIGRYDHATALFSGSPGGLYEAILYGEQTGADMRQLMVAQFLRIILVVTMLPIAMSIYLGHPVGSSAGMSFAAQDTGYEHLPFALLVVFLGLFLGFRLRLPAAQLVGPLLLGGVVTLSGLAVLDMPPWTLSLAQVVIGTSLGTRFVGLGPKMLLKGIGLAFLSVGSMLVIAACIALFLLPLTGERFDALFISFAPGGVTEMALVALSLNASPAFVTLHHLYRILLTVVVIGKVAKRYGGVT